MSLLKIVGEKLPPSPRSSLDNVYRNNMTQMPRVSLSLINYIMRPALTKGSQRVSWSSVLTLLISRERAIHKLVWHKFQNCAWGTWWLNW